MTWVNSYQVHCTESGLAMAANTAANWNVNSGGNAVPAGWGQYAP